MRTRASIEIFVALTSLACVKPAASASAGVQPEPAPSASASPVEVEAPGRTPRAQLSLHPVAAREGALDLAPVDGHAYLLLDGEPLALAPGVAPQRRPDWGRGIAPRQSFFGPWMSVVAIGGALEDGVGYLVTREDFERSGSEFLVYALADEGWEPRDNRRDMLVEFYAAIVRGPDDALFGLRSYEIAPDELPDEGDADEALWARIEAKRAAAPTGFAVLRGSPAVVPTLPEGWQATDAIATADGRIIALARKESPQLLEWTPGEATPLIRALPELDLDRTRLENLALWPASERTIVTGIEGEGYANEIVRAYLAIGSGADWTRIPVELPGVEGWDQFISSATIDDAGELWITNGGWYDYMAEPRPSLWRDGGTAGGEWRAVELPPPGAVWATDERWIHDPLQNEWITIPPGDAEAPAIARTVQWADGELWVLANLGRAYPTAEGLYVEEPRSVVYSSRAVTSATLLPGFDAIQYERVDHRARAGADKLGEGSCSTFTIVLLDDPDGDPGRRDAIIAKHRALAEPLTRSMYVGVGFDDSSRAQLVYDVQAWSGKEARGLVEAAKKELGVRARGDCRPRRLVRMIDAL